jgi:hypothetical protein
VSPQRFTEELATYTILTLDVDEYRPSSRELPEEYAFASSVPDTLRVQERKLLRQFFDDWQIPFSRQLRGLRPDSPLFVVRGDRLIGGVYLCDRNEFDDDPAHGQLHYPFMDRQSRGLGIYSVINREAVNRARTWGLDRLYFNTDRYLLPEVYLRWGARPWKAMPKHSHFPQGPIGSLLRRIYLPVRLLRRSLSRGG